MKYPVGIQTFQDIINGGYVYVDKTDLVYSLVSEGKIYFLSRPRRFGKSLLISTLENYFFGRKELFKGLTIEKLETEWKEYPVFRIDFNGPDYELAGKVEEKIDSYLTKWEREYGLSPDPMGDSSIRFSNILSAAHEQTGLGCVVLIDEYDKPMLDVMDSGLMTEIDGNRMTLEERVRNSMKAFYSALKLADADLKFVFLTGITKFAQISIFSGLNQLKDISMTAQYDELCGITGKEIDKYFSEPVAEMAEEFGCTVEEIRTRLRRRYDGYHFSKKLRGVYNPYSLLNAFSDKDIRDYWFKTATPTYLVKLLEKNSGRLDDLAGKYYSEDLFYDYKANAEQPLPIIYQSGYFTIKAYDPDDSTYLLDYPNDEVKRGFVAAVAGSYFKDAIATDTTITTLNKCLRRADLDKFRDELTAFLSSIPYTMRDGKSSEKHFHYTFYLIFRLISTYLVFTEKCQSQGRVDCVIETEKFIYIFEFKLDGTAEEALKQIEEKGYVREYASDPRKLYKIGCSFSSETGTIGEWMVKEM
jgi:hypothetical protein